MPFPLLIPIIVGACAALGAAVVLVLLNWERILNWFTGREKLKNSDKDNIAFTIQEKLASGKIKTIQGIFNKRTNEVPDGIQYESEEIDETLAEMHHNEPLVIYE